MPRRDDTRPWRVAALAARQHGVVSHSQLIEIGYRPSAISYQLQAGRLHPVFRGVYAVGHSSLPHLGRAHGAVLACAPRAALSHRSAAELWGLARSSRFAIDVTVVGRRVAGQNGIDVHFARAADVVTRQGIPITSVARTLLDYAEVVSHRWLERAWDQAERLELLDLAALNHLLTRSHGRRGLKPLSELIKDATAPEPTKSELEDMLRDICRAAKLPIPAFNVVVAGEEVDAYWPRYGLVVELDGWQHHRTRRDRERDLLKEEKVKLAGYRFHRFSYRRLQHHPDQVAAVLSEYLGNASILT